MVVTIAHDSTRDAQPPRVTWACMLLAPVVLLLLPGVLRADGPTPLWMIFAPVALGEVGTLFAVRGGRLRWGLASSVLGVAVCAVVVVLAVTGDR